MAAIIIPRRHYTQPHGRVELAPEWGTTAAILASANVEVRSGSLVTNRNSSHPYIITPNAEGIAYGMGGSAPYASGAAANTDFLCYAKNGASILWVGELKGNSTNAAYGSLFSRVVSTAASASYQGGWELFADGATQQLYLNIHEGEAGLVSYSSGLTVPIGTTVAISATLTNDGIKFRTTFGDAFVPMTPLSLSVGIPVLSLALGSRAVGFNAYTSATHNMGAFSADTDLTEALKAPWQLFKSEPSRIYSLPSGPISISWSLLTASNITQTGATLTLGGIAR